MDKIIRAMAAAGRDPESSDDSAGARLLALIRDNGKVVAEPSSKSKKKRQTSSSSTASNTPKNSPTTGAGGENRLNYDRDFLFSCADSPICSEMPKALVTKLDEFPQMKRKVRNGGGGKNYNHHHHHHPGDQHNHFRLFEQQPPSVVDSLPLRPTAQIFTWDPLVGQWVPRARPQEA